MTATTKNNYRPTLESLETRDMMDAGFTAALMTLPPVVRSDLLQTSYMPSVVNNQQAAFNASAALIGNEISLAETALANGIGAINSMNPAAISAWAIHANAALVGLYEARWAALDAETREAFFA